MGSRAIFLSYLPDGNGFNLWDLSRSKVVKSRDLLCHDDVFPTLKTSSLPPLSSCAEIPWPTVSVPTPPLPSPHPSLRHRCLSVSIHNPARKSMSPSMFSTLPLNPPNISSSLDFFHSSSPPSPTFLSPPQPSLSPSPSPSPANPAATPTPPPRYNMTRNMKTPTSPHSQSDFSMLLICRASWILVGPRSFVR